MSWRRLLLLLSALAAALPLPSAAGERAESSAVASVDREAALPARLSPREFARALLDETNRVRRAHGRRPLRRRAELEGAADDQAAFMALRMEAQHRSFLRGQATAFDRVQRRGLWVEVGAVAENVASTPLGEQPEELSAKKIAAQLVEQWMNSAGHRATLLDRNLTHFGGSVRLGKTVGGGWAAYGVQVFLASRPFGA